MYTSPATNSQVSLESGQEMGGQQQQEDEEQLLLLVVPQAMLLQAQQTQACSDTLCAA